MKRKKQTPFQSFLFPPTLQDTIMCNNLTTNTKSNPLTHAINKIIQSQAKLLPHLGHFCNSTSSFSFQLLFENFSASPINCKLLKPHHGSIP